MHLKKNLSVYHPDGYTRMVKKFIKTDGFFAQLEDGSTVEISRAKKDEFIDKVA